MTDKAQPQDWEAKAEAAYTRMYDAQPRAAKTEYEDACLFLHRAIDEATRLGLEDEVVRLTKRRDHIMAVYNSQFRGL
ncbi:MAG: hypothetical protein ABSC92_18445 [Rhizomicrobium sp.]|jgi:hypothetical protein